jgi:DNA-binding MarR family transcriptional regulator
MPTDHRIPFGLRAAYLAMHRQTDGCLAKRGATADQFVLLGLLAERDGITQQELVRRASSDPNTVRAMLVLLEKRGLVERNGHPTDRRARSVVLTRRGRQTYRKLLSETESLRERLYAAFRPEEGAQFVGFLARISDACAAAGEQARKKKGKKR